MSYTPKPNTGSLFANEKKETDSHPNAKGSAVIDGIDYWVDAWTNTTNDGKKYQSLKFKKKEPRADARPPAAPQGNAYRDAREGRAAPTTRFDDMPDDIPF